MEPVPCLQRRTLVGPGSPIITGGSALASAVPHSGGVLRAAIAAASDTESKSSVRDSVGAIFKCPVLGRSPGRPFRCRRTFHRGHAMPQETPGGFAGQSPPELRANV